MKAIPFSSVSITGGFWKTKQDLVRDTTVHAVYDRFKETHRFEALKCQWKPGDPDMPHIFWDSDVAKWIEGAAYILKKQSRPDLEEKIEHIIDMMEANQWEDGYVNSYFTVMKNETRFTNRDRHELY